MNELDEAMLALRLAVARLEAAPPPSPSVAVAAAADSRIEEVAATLVTRVDAALARLDRILAEEG